MKFTHSFRFIFILIFFSGWYSLCYSQDIVHISDLRISVIDTLPEILDENSGMFLHRGELYFINDSRNSATIYKWSIEKGCITSEIKVKNTFNIDWEDADADDKNVCIGDIGNNFGFRKHLKVFTFPIKILSDTIADKVKVSKHRYKYADAKGMHFNKNTNPYDAEGLFINGDTVIIFTKDRLNYSTSFYKMSLEHISNNRKLNKSGTIQTNGLITGACFNKSKETIALAGYNSRSPFILLSNMNNLSSNGSFLILQLISLKGYALESICFLDDNTLLVSSEKGFKPAVLIKIDISDFINQLSVN